MKDAYKKAIQFEKKGYDYYKKLSAEIKQPLAKRLFESLANQEKDHIEKIQEVYEAINSGNFIDEGKLTAKDDIEQSLKKIFFDLDESKKNIPLDDIEGYKLAMDMEIQGLNMYKKFANESENNKEKLFFEILMKEEQNHLASLENVYKYLNRTGDWYAEEESKVWNWMNT